MIYLAIHVRGTWRITRSYLSIYSHARIISYDALDEPGQADDVKVFNIPRKQAASTSGTKFEISRDIFIRGVCIEGRSSEGTPSSHCFSLTSSLLCAVPWTPLGKGWSLIKSFCRLTRTSGNESLKSLRTSISPVRLYHLSYCLTLDNIKRENSIYSFFFSLNERFQLNPWAV